MTELWKWFKTLVSGNPHFVIGGSDPYLLRWYLIPRNESINVYLHKFLRDDEDRALHDHPWWFLSLMVRGRYREMVSSGELISRSTPSIAFRPAEHAHRVILDRDESGNILPCWTIVMTGPKVREWGFYCPKGWVVWSDFVDHTDEGNVGKGCGE